MIEWTPVDVLTCLETEPDLTVIGGVKLTVDYDDAFVAYVNGVEVARSASMGGTVGTPPAFSATSNVCAPIFLSSVIFCFADSAFLAPRTVTVIVFGAAFISSSLSLFW